MNDTLNIVLLNTNYFKDILISNDYRLIINLSLLNSNYYKLFNDIYHNYILNEFPQLNKFDNLSFTRFDCKSWIETYRYIFTSPLKQLLLKNIDLKSETSLSLNSSFYLMIVYENTYLSVHTPISYIKSINNFPINKDQIKKDFEEFFELNQINNKRFISDFYSCAMGRYLFQGVDDVENKNIKGNTEVFNFLRKICSFHNKPSEYDVIYKLIDDKLLNITQNNIHIVF